jgi:hypothetical protein
MASIHLEQIKLTDSRWENVIKDSQQSTLFHEPKFLSYHGDRFDEHHLLIKKGSEPIGLIPQAKSSNNIMKSPYGASYGGFLTKSNLSYSDATKLMNAYLDYLKELKINQSWITPPLNRYFQSKSDTLNFVMLEHGYQIAKSEITSMVPLADYHIVSKIMSAYRKTKGMSEFKMIKNDDISLFWTLLEKTYEKHGKAPTHSLNEFKILNERYPDRIYVDIAYFEDKPIAGIAYFHITENVVMSFYHAQDDSYSKLNGQSCILIDKLSDLKAEGLSFYDYGTSTENMIARPNLFKFKENLGAIGIFRHTYSLKLDENDER